MAPRTALTVRSERGRIVDLHHVAGLPSPSTRALLRAGEKDAHARAHLVYLREGRTLPVDTCDLFAEATRHADSTPAVVFMGKRRRGNAGWGGYRAQEPNDPGVPDIERPPDQEVPGMGKEDVPAAPDGSGAPPFTGEDAEDVGPNPRNPHRPM